MSMPTDHPALQRVAWLALLIAQGGCPALRPPAPPPEPGPVGKLEPRRGPATSGRQVMVGEMCPQGAGGRPAVIPLMMKSMQWNDSPSEVSAAVERGSVPRWIVLGTDGKSAGLFDTLGVADVGMQQQVAAGTYVGASPCTADAGGGQRIEETACVGATEGCGLAVGELTRPDDPPSTPVLATAGACLSGDAIALDVDGDGVSESFPLASLLDSVRGPAQEWSAAPTAGAACKPTFKLFDIKLVRPPEPGKPVDPKSVVVLDVLGVVDLDGDARKELVIALRFPTVRTVVVYAASGSAQRLELVAEGQSFSR
ncbi:hypothetical protein BH11MYX3_BH11MYX3_13370 [soil metagenome]